MMAKVGTQGFVDEWPSDPYPMAMLTPTGVPIFNRMNMFEHSTLKALLTKGETYCNGLAKKVKQREAKAQADAAGARARGAAAGAGAGARRAAPAGNGGAQANKRPRSETTGALAIKIVGNKRLDSFRQGEIFGVGADKMAVLGTEWLTCADLTKVEGGKTVPISKVEINQGIKAIKCRAAATAAAAAAAAAVAAGTAKPKAPPVPGAPTVAAIAHSVAEALGGGPTDAEGGVATGGGTGADGGETQDGDAAAIGGSAGAGDDADPMDLDAAGAGAAGADAAGGDAADGDAADEDDDADSDADSDASEDEAALFEQLQGLEELADSDDDDDDL